MKLEDLRKMLATDVEAAKSQLETSAPLCKCCKTGTDRLAEYPGFGIVCFWCRYECFDTTQGGFDHSRMVEKSGLAAWTEFELPLITDFHTLQFAATCARCGEMRKTRINYTKNVHVIAPCEACSK